MGSRVNSQDAAVFGTSWGFPGRGHRRLGDAHGYLEAQQARERRSTGADALPRIVSLLEEVIAEAPRLDDAGGHGVLGLVLLRAPGWPAGLGDPGAGLEHARKADELVPDNPQNLLVLGEALAANGSTDGARLAYGRAETLARAAAAAGNPDAVEWAQSATRALKGLR